MKLQLHCVNFFALYCISKIQALHVLCISYNTGKSALPDTAPEGECVYIRQSTSACVISNIFHNIFHFWHSQNLSNLNRAAQLPYIVMDVGCD